MSGNLPFDLFIGERLPSSWYKYFSFWRNTFETVLHNCQQSKTHQGMQLYLLSTPNIARKLSVTCLRKTVDSCKHTSDLGLLDGRVLLVILAHSSAV
jgi:hypothetical protein